MRFTMDEKWVVIDANARNIINAMKQVLEKHMPDVAQRGEIDSTVERDRQGIGAKIKGWVEFAAGELGSREYKFNMVDKDLDPPAYVLCEEYRDELYLKLREYGRDSRDTESESIYSRHVLICEILLRFAATALSREENGKRDSMAFINAMDEFCDIIRKKGYLGSSTWMSDFSKFFATSHTVWLKTMREAVHVIKSMHANRKAVSDTLEYLKQLRYQIMRLIVACSGLRFVPDDLSSNQISNTFRRCEADLLRNPHDAASADLELQATIWDTTSARQDVIIAVSPEIERDRLLKLYKQLNDTELLRDIAFQFDMLMNQTGWVLILMGALKPSELAKKIAEHHEKAARLLTLSPKDPLFDKSIAIGLDRYNATSVHHLDKIAQESFENLMKLENPRVIHRIGALIGGSLSTLLGIQKRLNCQFLDEKLLTQVVPNLLPNTVTIEALPANTAMGALPAPQSGISLFSQAFSREKSLEEAKNYFASKR